MASKDKGCLGGEGAWGRQRSQMSEGSVPAGRGPCTEKVNQHAWVNIPHRGKAALARCHDPVTQKERGSGRVN